MQKERVSGWSPLSPASPSSVGIHPSLLSSRPGFMEARAISPFPASAVWSGPGFWYLSIKALAEGQLVRVTLSDVDCNLCPFLATSLSLPAGFCEVLRLEPLDSLGLLALFRDLVECTGARHLFFPFASFFSSSSLLTTEPMSPLSFPYRSGSIPSSANVM